MYVIKTKDLSQYVNFESYPKLVKSEKLEPEMIFTDLASVKISKEIINEKYNEELVIVALDIKEIGVID